jgi:hypothetical protein
MNKLPQHIEAELRRLIAEGMPSDQIAFMMQLDKRVIDEAINTTKNLPAQKTGSGA